MCRILVFFYLERYRDSERPFSSSKIESYDYGHGGAPAIVDYNHGKGATVSDQPESRPIEPPYRGQSASEGFPLQPPADPAIPSVGGYSFSPSMPYFPAGMDPAQAALIAAAYSAQAGNVFCM